MLHSAPLPAADLRGLLPSHRPLPAPTPLPTLKPVGPSMLQRLAAWAGEQVTAHAERPAPRRVRQLRQGAVISFVRP